MPETTRPAASIGGKASRRTFLRSVAGAGLLTAASYSRVLGANDRIGIGMIGYGLIGKRHVQTFLQSKDAEITAVSDCHAGRVAEGVVAAGGKATAYADFRKLLEDKSVNAVVVATPDHWHALMTMLACDAGKDVYVEKPLTLFVREGEWMQRVAERTRRVIQVGTQQRSGAHYQQARKLLQENRLGTVTSVRISAVRNVFPGFGAPSDGPPPSELNWDMWLGPSPLRKYNPNRGLYHFRWFWETSGGQMTNLGAHQLDIIDWTLGLDGLKGVTSVGGRYALQDNGETPDTQDALFDCGRFSIAFAMREASQGDRPINGMTIYGTSGSLGLDRSGFKITGDALVDPTNKIPGVKEGHPVGGPVAVRAPLQAAKRTEDIEDTSGDSNEQYRNHARNFLDCIRSRETPDSDLASAHRTSVACHLANISLRLKRSVNWNWKSGSVLNDEVAEAMLVRDYRPPWDRELKALRVI